VDAALRRNDLPNWPAVAITSTYVAGPLPGKQPDRWKPVVAIMDADVSVPMRVLSDPLYARLEWMRDLRCFAASQGANGSASVEFVSSPDPEIIPQQEASSDARTCLVRFVHDLVLEPFLNDRVRVTARIRAILPGREWMAVATPEMEADIAVLERIANGTDAPRARAAQSLLATRHVDAAIATGDFGASATHLARAEELFTGIAASDTSARPAALFGVATALAYENDLGRAQTPLRTLVCPSRFRFTAGAPSASPAPLAQDHPREYWAAWEERREKEQLGKHVVKAAADDETTYSSPYEACGAGPLDSRISYAEAWFDIGAFHEALDEAGGPLRLNRAATAYREAIAAATRSPSSVLPFARLALARTLYAQQRYQASARAAIELLDSSEIAAAPELVERASQLVAASLSFVDFVGPPEGAPFSKRPDISDTSFGSASVEPTLRVAIQRVKDPSVVPQDRAWTPRVVFWLAKDLHSLFLPHLEAEADELFLTQWPLHRDAPIVQADEAEAWRTAAQQTLPSRPERAMARAKQANVLANIARLYASDTAWARANATDALALAAAREVVSKAREQQVAP
jgi:hypothetical protein